MNKKAIFSILIVICILLIGCVEPKPPEEVIGIPVQVDVYTRSFNSMDTVIVRFEDGRIMNFVYTSSTPLPTLNKINRIIYSNGFIQEITIMEKNPK